MNSIWKGLLFLHGHIIHRDLAWRPDPQGQRATAKPAANAQRRMLAQCASVWPRLAGPR